MIGTKRAARKNYLLRTTEKAHPEKLLMRSARPWWLFLFTTAWSDVALIDAAALVAQPLAAHSVRLQHRAMHPPRHASMMLDQLAIIRKQHRRVYQRRAPGPRASMILEQMAIMYNQVLTRSPITTRIVTAAVLATTGDALAQKSDAEDGTRWDSRRTLSFVIADCIYKGLLLHPMMLFAIRRFNGQLLRSAALERALFNQLFMAPFLYYPLFFAVSGRMQGLTNREALCRMREQLPIIYGINLCYWIPVHVFQFSFVPVLYKVPFVCLAGLVWICILSQLAGCVKAWRSQSDTTPRAWFFASGF